MIISVEKNRKGHIKELHEQTSRRQRSTPTNDDEVNVLHLKEDLLAKETSLFQAQSKINDLTKALEQTRNEVSSSLRVHREFIDLGGFC